MGDIILAATTQAAVGADRQLPVLGRVWRAQLPAKITLSSASPGLDSNPPAPPYLGAHPDVVLLSFNWRAL